MGYCDEPITDSWSPANIARSYFCGVSSVIGSVAEPAASTLQHGQDVIGGAVEDVTTTAGGAVEDVSEAANPLNLAGAALGATVGAVATAAGIGLAAALAADWLLAGGAGTRALALWASGVGRRK